MIAPGRAARTRLGNLMLAGSDGPLPYPQLRRAASEGAAFPARVLDGDELARLA